jgi:acyl-CoA thioesterase
MGGALLPLLSEDEICATIEIKISFFKSVRSGKIACHSRVIHRGKRVASLDSEIMAEGTLIAKATGSFSTFGK